MELQSFDDAKIACLPSRVKRRKIKKNKNKAQARIKRRQDLSTTETYTKINMSKYFFAFAKITYQRQLSLEHKQCNRCHSQEPLHNNGHLHTTIDTCNNIIMNAFQGILTIQMPQSIRWTCSRKTRKLDMNKRRQRNQVHHWRNLRYYEYIDVNGWQANITFLNVVHNT